MEKIRDLACQSDILPAIFRGVCHNPWTWDGHDGPPVTDPTDRPRSPGQERVWDAAPTPTGANPITSSPGQSKATPTSTTWSSYAARCHHKVHDDRLASTQEHQPANTTSNHPRNTTAQQPANATGQLPTAPQDPLQTKKMSHAFYTWGYATAGGGWLSGSCRSLVSSDRRWGLLRVW